MNTALRILILATAFLSLAPGTARACEMCFGAGSDSPVVTAIGLSMLGLLLVTGFVLTGVTRFFLNMERRAKSLERAGFDERVSTNGDGH
jgi:hypothetical protein